MLLLLARGVGMGGSPVQVPPAIILICLIAHEREFRHTANIRNPKRTAQSRIFALTSNEREFQKTANTRVMAFVAKFRKPA